MTKEKSFIIVCLAVLSFLWALSGCSSEEKTDTPKTEKAEESVQVPEQPAETEPPAEKTVEKAAEQVAQETVAEAPAMTEGKTVADIIMLEPELWDALTRPAVKFPHKAHATTHNIACTECHHIYEDGKNVWNKGMPVAKCETCHNEPTVRREKQLPPEEQKKNLKLAFHDNCRGCHREVKKENSETTAPMSCNQCHEK